MLIGFDIDSCCLGFDGKQVLSLPRARRALANRVNIVDVDRQSTTFEVCFEKVRVIVLSILAPPYSQIVFILSDSFVQICKERFQSGSSWFPSFKDQEC